VEVIGAAPSAASPAPSAAPAVGGEGVTDGRHDGAFADLFATAYAPMVRVAVGIVGDPAVAEDVVQDAFAGVYRRIGRLDRPEAYLRRSVVNGCLKSMRHRRRTIVGAVVPEQAVPGGSGPAARELLDAVARLSPRRRAVVVLRYYADWSEAEIAAALGVRPGTVKSTLHAALAELREVVER
jgi:RNA polymerase sigma-70 factor (sigma-E family)